jgi:hypothetical protein
MPINGKRNPNTKYPPPLSPFEDAIDAETWVESYIAKGDKI